MIWIIAICCYTTNWHYHKNHSQQLPSLINHFFVSPVSVDYESVIMAENRPNVKNSLIKCILCIFLFFFLHLLDSHIQNFYFYFMSLKYLSQITQVIRLSWNFLFLLFNFYIIFIWILIFCWVHCVFCWLIIVYVYNIFSESYNFNPDYRCNSHYFV